jgi:hypothetical protein
VGLVPCSGAPVAEMTVSEWIEYWSIFERISQQKGEYVDLAKQRKRFTELHEKADGFYFGVRMWMK